MRMSSFVLKLWAIFAMTLDHIGWAFVPRLSSMGFVLHFLGRTTAPIMCFCLVEGYHYTRSKEKYLLRMLLAAVIAQIPFSLYNSGTLFYPVGNMLFTLFLCLIALMAWDTTLPLVLRILAVVLTCAAAAFCDWSYYAVLFCLCFHIFRDNRLPRTIAFCAVVCWLHVEFYMMYAKFGSPDQALANVSIQSGLFLAAVLLWFYSGQKGRGGRFTQFLFYAYYPAHLLVLYLLKIWLLPGQYALFG